MVNQSPGMNEREGLLQLIRSARYAEPANGTAESAWNAALDHIEEGLSIAAPAPSAWQPDPRTVEECAKIADPWPSFNVGQTISEPDLSVIAVRTKIAAAIRALGTRAPSSGQPIKPEALQALKNYMQADADGVMVYVSRQALDEAIAVLSLPSSDRGGVG